ncbi:YhcH/YjgK/YiaL family protein [Sodalis sp. RH23]|uniref:YhcH/YjgK/YiaL family protein n=1 Tax=unclassified Sodalis (in: enterobacteria) TaxID=2636512 RepID=UPI0039B6D83E
MIFSKLADWNKEQSAFHPVFNTIIDYIRNNDLAGLMVGKHIIIPDKLFFFMQSYDTIDLSECKPESHVEYVDFQYLLSGEEKIGFSRVDDGVKITEDKTPGSDMIYYDLNTRQDVLTIGPGEFGIFFPDDIHRTRGRSGNDTSILKAVFKIHLSMLV